MHAHAHTHTHPPTHTHTHTQVITSETLFQCKVVTNNNKDGLGVLKDTGKGLFNNCTVDAGLHEADVYNVNPHLRLLAEWNSVSKDRWVVVTSNILDTSVFSFDTCIVCISLSTVSEVT